MAQLSPCPFGALVTRMFREFESRRRIFDLPATAFVRGGDGHDYAVDVHGRAAATPFGPAAGPHSQLAQNIVLSWLAGGRIIELKTIQANDGVAIPRPCIDVRTVGFNVEWSQELTLEQSLEEYVKAAMLIRMLVASGIVELAPGFERFVFDISVGYDLAGVSSARVVSFMRGMQDADRVIERLRRQVPRAWREHAELSFDAQVAGSVTLSTFHGCPPLEIERILLFLLREMGMSATLKLNPTLLGHDATRTLLHDVLGYTDIRLVREAFDADLHWDDMCGLVERVARAAGSEGRGFGVKFTNTLVVENDGAFLPASEPNRYLSGPPLHVLAMHLVRQFRREWGTRLPVSFSGGIDRVNFPDAVALGLTPITVCTDLLKPGGYARAHGYFDQLAARMDAVGARTTREFVTRAYGESSSRDPVLANTERYVESLAERARYRRDSNRRPPRKIDRRLRLFDCLACDKCVPVCPNDANFTFVLPAGEIPCQTVWREDGRWSWRPDGVLSIAASRQIGNFADLCNDCGNCDVFCPEDGGPYRIKPRFFGSADAWRRATPLDGFFLETTSDGHRMLGRIDGDEYSAAFRDGTVRFAGVGFAIAFTDGDPLSTLSGKADGPVNLRPYYVMNALRKAILAGRGDNFVNCLERGA